MSTQFAVDLVFKSQGQGALKQAAANTEKVAVAAKKAQGNVDALTGKFSKSGRAIKTAANGMQYFIDATGRARKVNGQFVTTTEAAAAGLDKQGRAAKRTSGALSGLRSQLLGLGAGTALGFAAKTAASFEQTQLRLKLLSQEFGEYDRIQKLVAQNAATFNQSQKESAENFANVYARLRPLGKSLEEIQTTYEGFNAVAIASGASAQEASSAFLQLSQALGSGRLQGDEFRSISEQVPGILKLVSKEMNVTVGELKQLGADGKITSDVLINSLAKGFDQNKDSIAQLIALSPAQKFKAFQNATTELSVAVGQELLPVLIPLVETATKLLQEFGKLPGPVKTAAVAITAVGAAALIAAPAIGALLSGIASFAPAAIAAGGAAKLLAGGLVILKAAMLALPWVALAAGIAAAGVATYKYFERQKQLNSLMDGTSQDLKAYNDEIYNTSGELAKAEEKLANLDSTTRGYGVKVNALKKQIEELKKKLLLLQGNYDVQIRISTVTTEVARGNSKGFQNKVQNTKDELKALGYDYNGGSPFKIPTLDSSGGGSGGGGGGGGAAPKTDDLETLNRQYEKLVEIAGIQNKINQAKLQGDQSLATRLEGEKALTEEKYAGLEAIKSLNTEEGKRVQTLINQEKLAAVRVENAQQLLELDKQRKETLKGILVPIKDEIALLEGRINGNEEEIRQNQEILRLKNAILAVDPNADTSGVAAMVKQRDELTKQAEAADELKAKYEGLADSIAGNLTGAFKDIITGAKSTEEALSDAFAGIADAFLDMAMQMIQEWIKMQLLGIISSAFGGAPAGAGAGAGAGGGFGAGGAFSFAGGGYTGDGARTGGVDGQGGFPAILHPQETVVDHTSAAMSRYGPGNAGGSAVAAAAMEAEAGGAGVGNAPINISTGPVMQFEGTNYVTQEEFAAGVKSAAQQGEQRALRRLSSSPGSRRRIGL